MSDFSASAMAWNAMSTTMGAAAAGAAAYAAQPQPPPAKKKKKPARGYSVAKVAGVGVAIAALATLFALTVWRGPRVLSAPLFLATLSSAIVVLVVTGAGGAALEKAARGSLWLVTRAVCAADDALCAVRSVYATALLWLLACCVGVLYLLRWFIRR
jgi:hypothetical protein